MNKFFLLTAIAIIIFSCAQKNESKESHSDSVTVKTDTVKICATNPNGSSELALLMRSMYSHLSAIRANAIAGGITGEYPDFIDSIYTATPTDSTMVDDEFPSRAKEYIAAVKDLYHRYPESQKQAFNTAVSKCESCHTHYCPGPLEKIRKLYIRF